MHFAKVGWKTVIDMVNILGGNVMPFFYAFLKYLMEKTGTFVQIRTFLILRCAMVVLSILGKKLVRLYR